MTTRQSSLTNRTFRTLAVVILLAFGLWLYRIPFAENSLRSQFLDLGIPITDIEVTALNPWQAGFRNLQLENGAKLQRAVVEFDWPTPYSPRLKKVTLTGLQYEIHTVTQHTIGQSLSPTEPAAPADGVSIKTGKPTNWPQIELREAAIKIVAANDSPIGAVIIPSLSIMPIHDRSNDNDEGSVRQTIDVKANLRVEKIRTRDWEVSDSTVQIDGRLNLGNGQFSYRPQGCDRVTFNTLRKENITVSGLLAACLSAAKQEPAVVIGNNGKVSLNLRVEHKPARLNLGVAVLPTLVVDLNAGSTTLQFEHSTDGTPVGTASLEQFSFTMPGANIELEGIKASVTLGKANAAPQSWSLQFSARNLRHLTPIPALQPLSVAGTGQLSSQALSIDTNIHQPTSGLNAVIGLERDNETGEGELNFSIPSVTFVEDSHNVGDFSPLIAQYVARLAGEFNASGRLLFNDAWATPLQVKGSGRKLVGEMNTSSASQDALLIAIDRSTFKASLPPLSLHNGWATINVVDAGIQLGDADANELTGTMNVMSFLPLACRHRPGSAATLNADEDQMTPIIVKCLRDTFAVNKTDSSYDAFQAIMTILPDYLSDM